MNDYTTLEKNLARRDFSFRAFATGAEASTYLTETLQNRSIGIGGSMTVMALGLHKLLAERNEVAFHLDGGDIAQANAAEVYISSLNGLAETGELINIDGTGNRVSATAYGAKHLYFVVGKNKLAPDFEQALWRARNIAAPKNAARFKAKTPCVLKEPMRCHDCSGPERMCRELLILWQKPRRVVTMEIILIEEELGY